MIYSESNSVPDIRNIDQNKTSPAFDDFFPSNGDRINITITNEKYFNQGQWQQKGILNKKRQGQGIEVFLVELTHQFDFQELANQQA